MMSILTVITARGGSKGIPLKNIAPLCGKPLLEYTIESALNAKLKGKIVVSTDDEEIAAVAEKYNLQVIKRPAEISGDTASSESALLHALDFMATKAGFYPDSILTLQPTSPLRKAETINKFISKFEEIRHEYDAMISLHADHAFFWVKENENLFKPLFSNVARRRQARQPLHCENSSLYITNVDALKKTGSILGSKTAGFVIDADEALDINEPRDLLFAEFLLKQRNV